MSVLGPTKILAHGHVGQDPRHPRIGGVDRRQSEEGVDTADGVWQCDRRCTLSRLDRMVVNELNGRAIDSASVVDPAKILIPDSMRT